MFKESPRLIKVESAEEKEERELLERRDVLYAELIKLPSVGEALALLDNLPEGLVYHTKEHTEDVIKETILFALADGISEGTIEQQVIAAAWHDVGFLPSEGVEGEGDKDKSKEKTLEEIAVDRFKKSESWVLLDEQYREEIVSNILDTTMLVGGKGSYFEMNRSAFGYILDADMSNIGRKDFVICMNKIAKETGFDIENLKPREGFKSRTDFYAGVIKLLENHDWHTEGARRLRQEQKDENLKDLRVRYKHDLDLIDLENESIERKAA